MAKRMKKWKHGDGVPYVLRKRGFFYRHENCGYTASVFEAELYHQEDAELHQAATDGEAQARPVTDFLPGYNTFMEYIERISIMQEVVRMIHVLNEQGREGETL